TANVFGPELLYDDWKTPSPERAPIRSVAPVMLSVNPRFLLNEKPRSATLPLLITTEALDRSVVVPLDPKRQRDAPLPLSQVYASVPVTPLRLPVKKLFVSAFMPSAFNRVPLPLSAPESVRLEAWPV